MILDSRCLSINSRYLFHSDFYVFLGEKHLFLSPVLAWALSLTYFFRRNIQISE